MEVALFMIPTIRASRSQLFLKDKMHQKHNNYHDPQHEDTCMKAVTKTMST